MSAFSQPSPREIQPAELLRMIETGQVVLDQVIDVREVYEREYYSLEGSRHIPMNTIPAVMSELDPGQEWFLLCAHGVRSLHVLHYMESHGFSCLVNVTGGISAVAAEQGFQYD